MATVLYLAMKEEEFVPLMSPSVKTGWLDCCLSRSGPGLDCLPSFLPSGSLLILTDRLPFRDRICQELILPGFRIDGRFNGCFFCSAAANQKQ